MTDASGSLERGITPVLKTKPEVDADLANLQSLPEGEIPIIIPGVITLADILRIEHRASGMGLPTAGENRRHILFYQHIPQNPEQTLFRVNFYEVDTTNSGELTALEIFRKQLSDCWREEDDTQGKGIKVATDHVVRAQRLIDIVCRSV